MLLDSDLPAGLGKYLNRYVMTHLQIVGLENGE